MDELIQLKGTEKVLVKKFLSDKGVIKFKFGEVFPTETIIEQQHHDWQEIHSNYQLSLDLYTSKESIVSFELDDSDVVYGLGQSVRGMNKRGYLYESFCSDDPNHTPDKKSLYGAHNFFVVHGRQTWGLYIDFPGKVTYDVAFSSDHQLIITVEGKDFDVYFFKGSFQEIVTQFRELIGMSYVPPKWAFGYQQSRWSYENAHAVQAVADQFEQYDIPVDAIYLDIDYMDNFKDFTVSEERFPHFETFVSQFRQKGIHLVPIIDAGVKIESGYAVYEEGVKHNYFCTNQDGKPFVAAVWPGKVHFPDFVNPDARKWFGSYYHQLIRMGIDGFWNDMNEPAIFYSEDGLKEAIAFVKEQEGKNLDIHTFFSLKDKINQLSNSIKDYQSMYHQYQGEKVVHYDLHNLYGYFMTRAADESFKRYDPNRRFLLLTRASHIGMAKHSGIWTGDNQSWWEHLKLNIQMMPALNMSGFLYAGADTGGFGSHVSSELMIRWLQFSLFTPLLRNHSAMGTRVQEPWQFGEKNKQTIRDLIRLRYAFVSYLYSEYMKANMHYQLLFSPLSYSYVDFQTLEIEDQLNFGDSLMLAPIYEQNAKGRSVYFPEKMLRLQLSRFESLIDDLENQVKITDRSVPPFEIMTEGFRYVKDAKEQFSIYLKPDRLLVLNAPENRVDRISYKTLYIVGYVETIAEYFLYNDDGNSYDFKEGKYSTTRFAVQNDGMNAFRVSIDTDEAALGEVIFYLFDATGKCHKIVQPDVRSNIELRI